MGSSYIPARDNDALTWMQTFAGGLVANAALYQVSDADAANVQSAVTAFAAAYAVAKDPAQRNAVTVIEKDQARVVAEELCRQFAILIKANSGISDADKVAIGVRPVNPSRQPINPPSSSPVLNIVGATPGSHTVRYADAMDPENRAKPFGALQLQLFVAIGPEPVEATDAAQFYGAFTRNPIGVGFDDADDGKVATYFARWASRRGDTGPWSLPVSMRIAA